MPSLLVLNGPNLNLLGTRQPDVYGRVTLKDIEDMCRSHASARGAELAFEQTNHEGTLVDLLHDAKDTHDAVILNAGAYTHTSVAVMDAVTAIQRPVIELHLSNIHAREPFRHTSYLSPVALGLICGFGAQGYVLAIDAALSHLGHNG